MECLPLPDMISSKIKRNSNVELMRFVMMIGICIWHLLVHGYNLKSMWLNEVNITYLQLLLMCILVPSVNVFIFISGYYGIKLRKEKLINMFLQAAFFYFVIILIRHFFQIEALPLKYVLFNAFPLTNIAWWFLICYVVLMIISPIVEKGIASMNKREFSIVLFLLFFVNSIGTWQNHYHTGSDLMGLLTIYLIGRYVKIYKISLCRRSSFLLYCLFTFLLCGCTCILHKTNHNIMAWTMFMYCNPIIIMQAIALFFFVKGSDAKPYHSRVFDLCGKHCFAIYLVTEFSANLFYHWWARICDDKGWLMCVGLIVLVCLFLVVIDYLRDYFCSKIVYPSCYKLFRMHADIK